MPLDFSDFNQFDLDKIKEWETMSVTQDDIDRWKDKGVLPEKLYEFKMKKLYLEYLKVKMQNELSQVDPFTNYNPVNEAERILRTQFGDNNPNTPDQ